MSSKWIKIDLRKDIICIDLRGGRGEWEEKRTMKRKKINHHSNCPCNRLDTYKLLHRLIAWPTITQKKIFHGKQARDKFMD